MNRFLLILSIPLVLGLGLGAIWFAFWFCNCAVWIMSLSGIISYLFFEYSTGIVRIIGYMLGLEFLYPACFYTILHKFASETLTKENWWYHSLLSILLTVIIVITYDPRCVSFLPEYLSGPVRFLQDSWNFRLLGGVSWDSFDFSGKVDDPLYLTVFDVMIIIVCLLWNFLGYAGAMDDIIEKKY